MAESVASTYQHFVPQFLIKNFSHPFKPQNNGGKKSQRGRRQMNGMFPNDPAVHNLNFLVDPAVLCEAPVKRIFGQTDMYRDTSKASTKQQHIEEMFSKLENRASTVFRKIIQSFEQKNERVWLTRDEKDLVRKFLFLLKYRGSAFHQRLYHETAECYGADDRELLHDYMAEKGYTRPMDVWLDNLKTIMELHMDPEKKWMLELPRHPSDEFILTENSYNVFEGPNCFVADKDTGKVEGGPHIPLHEFAPISPKLMIVLRSDLLPVPEEDASPDVKEYRRATQYLGLGMNYQVEVKSILADLPIAKARNNYSTITNGRVQLNNGETGKGRKDHRFCFEYFPISTEHVQIINGIFLDNAYPSSRIVLGTKDIFSRTLESYLSGPCTYGKIIMGDDAELRLAFMKKLAVVSRSLGSDKEPVWKEIAAPVVAGFEKYRLGITEMRRLFTKIINGKHDYSDAEPLRLYNALGGSFETLLVDMHQASLMWTLRVRIDSWSRGLDESLRHRNRLLLIQAYLRLPPPRVWLFVKHSRLEFSEQSKKLSPKIDSSDCAKQHIEEPEDTTAKGKVASRMFKTEKLAQLMYKAVMNDTAAKKLPDVSSWPGLNNLNLHGLYRIIALKPLAFIEPRYIRDCGLIEVEQLAQKQQLEVLRSGQHQRETFGYPFLEEGEIVELLTRKAVRSHFLDVLSGKLEPSSLKALKDVFFEIVYPTPT